MTQTDPPAAPARAPHQAQVMDRQLAASVWPSVRYSYSNNPGSNEGALITFDLDNFPGLVVVHEHLLYPSGGGSGSNAQAFSLVVRGQVGLH